MSPLLRIREVQATLRRGRSSLHQDVKAGMLTPAIKVGARAVAWPSAEVLEVLAARIAGQSEVEIRALVKRLVADRRKLLTNIDPGASGVNEDPVAAQTVGGGKAKRALASTAAAANTR